MSTSLVSAQSVVTNGVGEYREFNKPALMIKLDLGIPTKDALEAVSMDVRKQLSFRMLEDRSARRWSQIWIQNLSINSPPTVLTKQTDDLIRMTQAIPSTLLRGDLVEFERVANDLTLMIVDGVEVAEFQTPDFFEFLLSAFIGPVPPSSELKSSLLQAGDINSDASALFGSIGYSKERSNTVTSWTKPVEPKPEPVVEPAEQVEVAESSEDRVEEIVYGVQDDTEEQLATTTTIEDDTVILDPTEASIEQETLPAEEVSAIAPIELAGEPIAETASLPEPVAEDAPILITADSLLAVQNYQRQMLLKIYQNMEYPRAAQRRNREGSLRVAVSLKKDGSLDNVALLQQADYDGFNEAALAAIDSALPFNDLPESILDLPMTVEIPIQFRLQ